MKSFIIVLFVIFIALTGCSSQNLACIDEKCYKVTILDSSEERSRGLMLQDNLAQDEGAFFIFENEQNHGIWMKNMQFPIDIIWIDADNVVVDVKEEAQPCMEEACPVYFPIQSVRYVLEVNTNSGIEIGDIVELR